MFALTKSLLYVYQPALSCDESMWSLKGQRVVISWSGEAAPIDNTTHASHGFASNTQSDAHISKQLHWSRINTTEDVNKFMTCGV